METLTDQQLIDRYGAMAASKLLDLKKPNKKEEGAFSQIKNAFSQGINTIGQGLNEAKPIGGGGVSGLITGTGKILGGATEAITSPLAPVMNPTIGAATNYAANKISDIPAVQKFSETPAGQTTAKVAETVGNYANAAGLVAGGVKGGKTVAEVPGKIRSALESEPQNFGPSDGQKMVSAVRTAVGDVVPNRQNVIDHNLARALDLTPGDLSTIEASTGNPVGKWMADNNLIGTNKENTHGLIQSFFKQNYDSVRNEIGKVDQAYKPNQIPRFTDALKVIQTQIKGVVGLEKQSAEIENLLMKKGDISLADVQRVKELLDEHFSLYKATGDVGQGVAKEGLANVRGKIKNFIEQQVQEHTGADIRQMNNNVSTAKNLADAIEKRSTRGLTRANLTWRDVALGSGLTYFANPLAGMAAVLGMKVITSPTARLRFARYLDGLTDAERAKISLSIKDGEVPKGVQEAVGPLE